MTAVGVTRLLNPGQAAHETGLDVRLINDALTSGTLPGINRRSEAATRNAWRISPAALDAWIAAGCPTA